MLSARDIMETEVITVAASTPLVLVYRLFDTEDISGAPVVETTGEVVGVISTRDLLRAANEDAVQAIDRHRYYCGESGDEERSWLVDLEPVAEQLSGRTASDVMSEHLISVAADASVEQMAGVITENRIHRVWWSMPRRRGCAASSRSSISCARSASGSSRRCGRVRV